MSDCDTLGSGEADVDCMLHFHRDVSWPRQPWPATYLNIQFMRLEVQNYDNMNKATWVLGWHSGTTCWVLSLGSIVCNSTPGWNVAVWWLGSLFIPFAPVTNQYQSMAATLCGWEGNQWCWDIFRVRSRIWGRTVEIEARARKWKRWTRHDWGSHPEVKARQMETEA